MTTAIEIEDGLSDILGKAQRGNNLSDLELMERTGLSMLAIKACLAGAETDADTIYRMAEALCLNPEALLHVAQGDWQLADHALAGFTVFHTPVIHPPFPGMTVNSYLAVCPTSGEALLVDAGLSLVELKSTLGASGKSLGALLLTHTHGDHLQSLDAIREAFPKCRIFSPTGESVPGTSPVDETFCLSVGSLTVQAIATPGHSPDGKSFHISGLGLPVICCGDAVFARSVGKIPPQQYKCALDTIGKNLLSHPGHTLLAPGHGPLTTVGEELKLNPFLAT